MPNINSPRGLRSLGISLTGGPPVIETFSKPASLDTAIFRHDPVARLADGSISAKSADITPGTTLYSGVALNHGAASTATEHAVIINPDAMYEAQANGSGLAAADMGLNANLVAGAGNAATKISKWEIASSTANTSNALDVHLLRLFDVVGNEYGAYARIEVVFNKHRMYGGVAGV